MFTCVEITDLLIDWTNGNTQAQDQLFPLVEKELHRLAHYYMRSFKPGNTIQTTALINETYIRLIDQKRINWQNRAHFFGIAAKMMRRIMLNYVRDRKRLKRGGTAIAVSLSDTEIVSEAKSEELLALDEALKQLSKFDERKANVVEMRFFGGLSVEETAEVLKVSRITVMRDWRMAKAWLYKEMTGNESEGRLAAS
ncbi:MAG: sigma-70 family RNA polymerase sigma factor [Pyrinomonadaceae bacterium]